MKHPRLLNDQGQLMLENAYDRRARIRGGFGDFAEGYVSALKDTRLLEQYLEPTLDPFEELKYIAKMGVK